MFNGIDTEILPKSYCDLNFIKPVARWDDSIPLGNGFMGCLVWGDGKPLRFSADRGDLWDTRLAAEMTARNYNYKELIKLVRSKDVQAIKDKFEEPYFNPTPTKIPAGALELDYKIMCTGMESRLCLANAVCDISMDFDSKYSRVKAFLHAGSRFGYISISGSADLPDIILKAPDFAFDNESTAKPEGLKQLGYPEARYGAEGCLKWYRQKTFTELEYALITAISYTEDNSCQCAFTVASNADGCEWFDNACDMLKTAIKIGLEELLEEHAVWWRSYWQKSSISICDREIEKMWYVSNYLFGSCSRKGYPPMPLQGVWTADDGGLPPWKGDYHNDLNTQMSYWHYMKANHMDEGEAFIDFLWKLVPQGKKFAKDFFDAPGICLPSVMGINGEPLGGWAMYSSNLINQVWLCQAFDHYWQYTGDNEFLKERAYPYFKSTAECILRWLEKGSDGMLYLPLSSSPEIHDNSMESWVTPSSNNDLSLLIYLFKTLKNMAEELDNGDSGIWKDKLSMLPGLAVNERNVLMISPDESLKESHRHHSHAMAIYPLNLLDYCNEKDKKIIDATVNDLELLGTGLWVGFSFPWMSELYTIQGNGEGAAYQLKLFWENFCSQNGFHLNGDFKKRGVSAFHYRPFTLEANMAAADALQEMLMKDDGGIIRVFSAIPDEWRKNSVSFRNFRSRKGVLVSSSLIDGMVQYVELKAQHAGEYRLANPFDCNDAVIEKNVILTDVRNSDDGILVIQLESGENCRISSSRTTMKE